MVALKESQQRGGRDNKNHKASSSDDEVSSEVEKENHRSIKKTKLSETPPARMILPSNKVECKDSPTVPPSSSSSWSEANEKANTDSNIMQESNLSSNDNDKANNNTEGGVFSQTTRLGRWTLDEKIMFLYGLSLFGKGRWKKIHAYVPDRSLVQIKSHAQKVLKRLEVGENVFRRLEDNRERVKVLVDEANLRIREKEAAKAAAANQSKKKRKRASSRKQAPAVTTPLTCSFDHIDAAMEAATAAIDQQIEEQQQLRREQQQQIQQQQQMQRPLSSPFSSSPTPSLTSAPEGEDLRGSVVYGGGICASSSSQITCSSVSSVHVDRYAYSWPSSTRDVTTATSEMPTGGTGAVIAAVAALCQLSASVDP